MFQQLTRNAFPLVRYSHNQPTEAWLNEQAERLFTETLQSRHVDWQQIEEDYDIEQEYSDDDDFDSFDDFFPSYKRDRYDEMQRVVDHKQPFQRRFRQLRNKGRLRRYGNAFDRWEKSRNDSPHMFKTRRDAIAVIREQEVTEPLRALKTAVVEYGSWNTRKARRELKEQGYYFNWRKTIDTLLAENNTSQHALSNPETDFWAYCENPYGKNGIEPSWRKIGTYEPQPDLLVSLKDSQGLLKKVAERDQLVYDWRTGSYSLPTPSKPTTKSTRIILAAHGCGGGGIRTMHS